jgi:hypothetical protein
MTHTFRRPRRKSVDAADRSMQGASVVEGIEPYLLESRGLGYLNLHYPRNLTSFPPRSFQDEKVEVAQPAGKRQGPGAETLEWASPAKRARHKRGFSTPKPPRTREVHEQSEGESDNEDPDYVYRALRRDESDPLLSDIIRYKDVKRGLYARDPGVKVDAAAHVRAGSKKWLKTDLISTSRSKKVAAWLLREQPDSAGLLVKILKPRWPKSETFDLTTPEDQEKVFGEKRRQPAVNFAKASQEVLIRDYIPPQNIVEVWSAWRLSPEQYANVRNRRGFFEKKSTRAKTSDEPIPFLMAKLWERK